MMLYKDQEEFVKGQKIKLLITAVILIFVGVHSYVTHTPFFK